MAKEVKRQCPACGQTKSFRSDNKTCGCKKEEKETHQLKGNTWEISIPKTRIHTLEELLSYCEVDLTIWEVDRFIVNKWEVGAKNKNDSLVVEPLYQVKAWLKKKVEVLRAKNEIQRIIEDAKKFAPKYPKIVRRQEKTQNLLEINLTDHHFGKLAWSIETGGWGDYDLKIANKCWDEATDSLISRVSGLQFDRAIFVVGNDLMHVDNQSATTTSGTQLSTDTRFQKIYVSVRKAIIRSLDKLAAIAPVTVVVLPGNHDQNASFCMGDSIYCWYRNCPEVFIDNSPSIRKYFQWGDVMLMWTHGNEGKLKDYPQIMAAEQPAMWGSTRIREVHTGDKHQRRVEEFHGTAVRIMPTLCPPDEWHSRKGFVGNLRTSEAFVWNKSEGLIGTVVYTENRNIKTEDSR